MTHQSSLSARRAWIEIPQRSIYTTRTPVALRKESVDRNFHQAGNVVNAPMSLSARRAWIEMTDTCTKDNTSLVALRKESVDRNGGGLSACARGCRVALRKESVDRNYAIL